MLWLSVHKTMRFLALLIRRAQLDSTSPVISQLPSDAQNSAFNVIRSVQTKGP